jgi:uncharacterized membrane-anchored protein
MTDIQLLIVSIIGIIAFYFVTRYINKRVTGTDQELKIKKGIKIVSIIYGVAMTIQIISIIGRLLETTN